jgi:hypothetical protein
MRWDGQLRATLDELKARAESEALRCANGVAVLIESYV